MAEGVAERLAQLEDAVRRATEALQRLRDENERLKRDVARFTDERRQVLTQIESILNDIGKLDLE